MSMASAMSLGLGRHRPVRVNDVIHCRHQRPSVLIRCVGVVLLTAVVTCSATAPMPPEPTGVPSASLGSSFTASSIAPDDFICDGETCLSPSIFLRRLHEQLDGKVVGYVGFVGDAPVMTSGPARKDTDPPGLAMGPDVLVNTASVGKIFTTVEVLKTLASHGLGVDTAIGPYLPADWIRGPGIDAVTFEELLAHRAGFRADSVGVFTNENAARDQVATGLLDSAKQFPSYNNINFSIMRDLLPQLDQAPVGTADQWFVDRVQRDVFDPVGVHSATCAGPVDPMLFYTPHSDAAAPGKVPPVGPAACSSGGWFITASDLYKVLGGLHDGSILSSDLTALMDGQP